MLKPRFLTITGLILLAAASRLLPHPPNFAPIIAIALFGGAYFSRKWMAIIVPFIIMFITDLILGFHTDMLAVYVGFALIVGIGFMLRNRISISGILGASLGGSVLFFLITNFSVWLTGTMYPYTAGGLVTCFAAGIPFFHYSVISTLVYSSVLFGAFELAKSKFRDLAVVRA